MTACLSHITYHPQEAQVSLGWLEAGSRTRCRVTGIWEQGTKGRLIQRQRDGWAQVSGVQGPPCCMGGGRVRATHSPQFLLRHLEFAKFQADQESCGSARSPRQHRESTSYEMSPEGRWWQERRRPGSPSLEARPPWKAGPCP